MNDERPDPDALLASLKKAEAQARRGVLKIFFGMAPGVGKTYAMLEAAQKARAAGRDVVVAYLETHGRAETDALAAELPVVPRKPSVHRGMTLTDMDLDAVLARKPALALVDELAHTNAPGARHPKRYQDVLELIEAGIDVYSTMNVQHLESRAGTVQEITGATIHETVPDSVLDAAEIEIVDLPPDELLKRLDEGKVYLPDRAGTAVRNFFRPGNLTALREMALRVAAEQIGQDVRDYMQSQQIAGPWKTGHRLMVAISPSPYSEQMVRWTRRLADSLECSWVAAYVESARVLGEDEQTRLTKHLTLARQLGAEVRTTVDEDIVRGLLRIARTQNVTQIVVGKSGENFVSNFARGGSLLKRLVRESGNIDLHIIRAETAGRAPRPALWRWPRESPAVQYGAALGGVIAITLLNLVLSRFIGAHSVGLVFLVGIVGMALRLGRGPVYLAATLSALIWNYFFLPPKFTFYIQNFDDLMMFGMYFVVAVAMGRLISRIRAKERMDRRREERASAMYMLTLELGDAASFAQIERVAIENIERFFTAGAAVLRPDATGQLAGPFSEKELAAAQWALDHATPTGRFTDTLPMTEAMYLPLQTTAAKLGVLRVNWRQTTIPTLEQRNLLDQFLRHIALVLDRQRLREAEAQARIVAESERLGRALLNSISHELRTPIAAIQSAAGGLATATAAPTQQALAGEIQEAADRLNRIVGNLLDMTRLEAGHLKPRLDWCDVRDVINAALRRVEKKCAGREVTVSVPAGLPLARLDAVLMEQVLTNLLLNVALHTPAATPVQVTASVEEGAVHLSVSDRGPGLPPDALDRIFDKFYRAPSAPAGGIGLGLSIVKGFVEVQGATIRAENRAGGGAQFTIALPPGEPPKL